MFTHDFRIHVAHLIGTALWSLAFLVWAVSWSLDEMYMAALAIMLSVGAATMSVQGFFVTHNDHMKAVLAVTGRDGSLHSMQR